MSNDYGRNSFVAKFFCKECGKQLNMSSDGPNVREEFPDNEPTGAYRALSKTYIYPCSCQNVSIEEMIRRIVKNDK